METLAPTSPIWDPNWKHLSVHTRPGREQWPLQAGRQHEEHEGECREHSALGRGPRGEQTARFVVCAAVEALPAGFCVGRTSAQHPLPRGACLFPANFCLCPETFSCSGPPIFQQERWEQGQLLPPSSPSSLSPLFLSPADSQQTREGLLGVSIRMKWFGPDCITRV